MKPKEDLACLVREGGHKPCRYLSYRCVHVADGNGLPYHHCRTCGRPLRLEFTYKWEVSSKESAGRERTKKRLDTMYD